MSEPMFLFICGGSRGYSTAMAHFWGHNFVLFFSGSFSSTASCLVLRVGSGGGLVRFRTVWRVGFGFEALAGRNYGAPPNWGS